MLKIPVRLDFRAFGPLEAARIANVKPALIRDWRRRGIVATDANPKFYTPGFVAHMLLLSELSDQGFPIKRLGFLTNAIGMILHYALEERSAWELKQEREIYSSGEFKLSSVSLMSEPYAVRPNHPAHYKSPFENDLETPPWQFMIIREDEHELTNDIAQPWAIPPLAAVMTVVDLQQIGKKFAYRAKGHFAQFLADQLPESGTIA